MKFPELDARRTLDEVTTRVGPLDSVDEIVMAALGCLTTKEGEAPAVVSEDATV